MNSNGHAPSPSQDAGGGSGGADGGSEGLMLAGGDDVPAWFKTEEFEKDGFDADTYVDSMQRYVPMEALQSELERYLDALKKQLVTVINEDYSDFVSLGTKLVNVDGAVIRMRKPLLHLRDQLLGVQKDVEVELTALQAGLQRRKDLASARAVLELLQDAAIVLSKVQKLLQEQQAAGLDAAGGAKRAAALERISGELSRLQFYVAKGADLAFIQGMSGQVEELTASLAARLASTATQALQAGDAPALGHCLRAYAAIGKAPAAEALLAEAAVRPIVEEVLKAHASDGKLVLQTTLPELQMALEGLLQRFPELRTHSVPGLQAYHVPARCMLPEVLKGLSERCSGAFSPGVPSAFLPNHTAAMTLLDSLEALCPTRGAVEEFRAAEAYTAYLKKWNLSVYFSLRFQEIAGSLHSALPRAALEPAPDGAPPGVRFKHTAVLLESLRKSAGGDVFMPALADRFLRLALQLMARYAAWVKDSLLARQEKAPAAAPTQQHDGAAAAEPERHWARTAAPEDLAALAADTDIAARAVRAETIPAFKEALSRVPNVDWGQIEAAIEEGASSLNAAAAALIGASVAAVADRCVPGLRQMKNIATTFRMTSKAPPTRASHYVAGVLLPARQFLATPEAAPLSGPPHMLGAALADAVAARMAEMASDLLETVRKTEASLQKLKKAKAAGAGGPAGAMSDMDKIVCQLDLDARALGAAIAEIGVDVDGLPAYGSLLALVAPKAAAP